MSQLAPEPPAFVRRLPITRSALDYARGLYDARRREGRAPLLAHPLEVARLLYQAGYPDEVVAAGVLHDLIEDTGADIGEVRRRFGDRVATLVGAVTEDHLIVSLPLRKLALRRQIGLAETDAFAIFAADKVSKLRGLRAAASDRSPSPTAANGHLLEHYLESARLLERLMPGHPLVQQLRLELEALPVSS